MILFSRHIPQNHSWVMAPGIAERHSKSFLIFLHRTGNHEKSRKGKDAELCSKVGLDGLLFPSHNSSGTGSRLISCRKSVSQTPYPLPGNSALTACPGPLFLGTFTSCLFVSSSVYIRPPNTGPLPQHGVSTQWGSTYPLCPLPSHLS